MLYQGSVGQWDAVEGAQNFADYSDHGDHLAQDAEEASARQDTKWGVIGALAAESVAMCRTVSRSSAGSFKVRPSKISSSSSSSNSRRLRIQSQSQTQTQTQTQTQIQTCLPATSYVTALPANTAHLYGLSNAANYFYYSSNSAIASAMNGMNPDQYLAMCSQTISPVTSYSTSPYTTDQATGFGQHSQAQQHVNPACTQMTMDGFDHFDGLESLSGIEESLDGLDGISGLSGGYEPSVAAISPQSWGSSSSRRSSPDRGEDTWSLPLTSSPAESHGSPASSPLAIEAAVSSSSSSSNSSKSNSSNNNSNNNNNNNNNNTNSSSSSSSSDGSNVSSGSNNNDTATAVAMQQKRSNSEGESARDHPLYKKAVCQPDGYYHCPWEGDENCNHKPEKLKCNYDKFVDSHLKPYRCKHSACESARFSSTACLLRHEREAHAMHGHGDKPYLCPQAGCDRAHPGFGFPRQWNLKDHMRRVHHADGKQLERMAAAAAAAAAAAESSPVAVSSSQAVSKGRKRKKDSPSGTTTSASSASSSRKSSASSKSSSSSSSNDNDDEDVDAAAARRQAEAFAALEAAHKAAIEKKRSDFLLHKNALYSKVMDFTQPDDPAMLSHLQEAQKHLDELSRISNEMLTSMQQGPFAFPQQSG